MGNRKHIHKRDIREAVEQGIEAGIKLASALTPRLLHSGPDGLLHTHPRFDGCEVCAAVLSIRASALAGEDYDPADVDELIRTEARRRGKGPKPGYKIAARELELALKRGGQTLEQLKEVSGLSRAAVARRLRMYGAKKIAGTGTGRSKAVYKLGDTPNV